MPCLLGVDVTRTRIKTATTVALLSQGVGVTSGRDRAYKVETCILRSLDYRGKQNVYKLRSIALSKTYTHLGRGGTSREKTTNRLRNRIAMNTCV